MRAASSKAVRGGEGALAMAKRRYTTVLNFFLVFIFLLVYLFTTLKKNQMRWSIVFHATAGSNSTLENVLKTQF